MAEAAAAAAAVTRAFNAETRSAAGRSGSVTTGEVGVAVVVVVELVEAPLFCRLILAISSSSESCLAVVTLGFTDTGAGFGNVGVTTGDAFFVLPFSVSCRRFITRGESIRRKIPLNGPLATSSVLETLFGFSSFSLKRTCLDSLSESLSSWWLRANLDRKRPFVDLLDGSSS